MDDSVFLSEADSKRIEFKTIYTGKIKIFTAISQNWTSIQLSAIIDS